VVGSETLSGPDPSTIAFASPVVTRACGSVGPAQPVLPGLDEGVSFVALTWSEGAGPTEASIEATSLNESCMASKFCRTKGLHAASRYKLLMVT